MGGSNSDEGPTGPGRGGEEHCSSNRTVRLGPFLFAEIGRDRLEGGVPRACDLSSWVWARGFEPFLSQLNASGTREYHDAPREHR